MWYFRKERIPLGKQIQSAGVCSIAMQLVTETVAVDHKPLSERIVPKREDDTSRTVPRHRPSAVRNRRQETLSYY